MSRRPRRIMADMLLMSAFKVRDPVETFVLMESHDFARFSGYFSSHGFHMEPTCRAFNLHLRGVFRLLVNFGYVLVRGWRAFMNF